MRSIISLLLFLFNSELTVSLKCEEGHATCIAQVGRASYCKPESNTCHGSSTVACYCEDSPPQVAPPSCSGAICRFALPPRPISVAPIMRLPADVAAGLVGDKLCHARVGASSWCRVEDGTCQGDPTVVCASAGMGQAAAPREAVRSISVPRSDIFLWLEWPTLESSEWPHFYDSVVQFVSSNCANYRVTRVIARVLSPVFHEEFGKLWQVGTDSVFYTHFLSRISPGVDIQIYPHLVGDESIVGWTGAMDVETPLEGAYKYVSQWNAVLVRHRPGVLISGIVTDKEESRHFLSSLKHIPGFRDTYSTRGHPSLRFGIAMGYTQPDGAPSISEHIDDVYLEMYDFYVDRVYPPVHVDAGSRSTTNQPERFLTELDNRVWQRYLPLYARERNLHFMWSTQRRGPGCLFPTDSNTCGSKDDFGTWDVQMVNQFFSLIESKYPVFRNSPKGFFQFSYIPTLWATSCPRVRS